jgi:hypothetical protein
VNSVYLETDAGNAAATAADGWYKQYEYWQLPYTGI